jgi:Peptidase family C25.
VRLRSFEATSYGDAVVLEWQTGYEIDNLGYHIYREQNGQRIRITPSVVAGSALFARAGTELTAGYSYAWQDRLSADKQAQGLQYWLEDLDLDGTSNLYGPFTPSKSNGLSPDTKHARLLSDLGSADSNLRTQGEWPTASSSDGSTPLTTSAAGRRAAQRVLDQQWTIAGMPAVKLTVNRDGWQRVSREELLAAGLDAGAELSRLQLFADGIEQAIAIMPDGALEFYGQALDTPATESRVYWLIAGSTPGKRVQQIQVGEFEKEIEPQTFMSTVERRDRIIRFAALLNGEAENFFGPPISTQPVEQRLILKGLEQESGASAVLEVALQGLSSQPHEVRVQVNGTEVGTINFSNREHPLVSFNVSSSLLLEDENVITLTRGGVGATDLALVDFVRLSYPRKYQAVNNRLRFSVARGQAVQVDGFTTPQIRVLDITNAAEVKELMVTAQEKDGSYAFSLPAATGTRILLALADQAEHPLSVRRNEPSSWNSSSQSADFVIITHRNFRQAVEALRLRRQRQGLKTVVVDVEDVFDEFSYGAYSPQALRAFLSRSAAGWQRAPRYVLLVGDATYDPRHYFGGNGEGDLVPGLLVDTAFMETTSDDALADFDEDGLSEMAVGRLPVRTPQEAAHIVARILSFDTGDPADLVERGALIVSDRPDGFDFQEAGQEIRAQLPTRMPVEMINRADGDTATIRNQIINGINRGPMLVTYLGHGSVGVWTGDGLLTVADTGTLSNSQRLPLFVMTTCLNGAYMEVGTDGLGEALIKAPQGGAIAAWASSGMTEPGGQVTVTQTLYQTLLGQESVRLGDAIRRAKESTSDPDIRRTWILLGDPTLRLR